MLDLKDVYYFVQVVDRGGYSAQCGQPLVRLSPHPAQDSDT